MSEESLDDAIRDMLDLATGWCRMDLTPDEKLKMIAEIGEAALRTDQKEKQMSEKIMTKRVIIHWKGMESASSYNFVDPVEWKLSAEQSLNGKYWTIEVDDRIDYIDLDEARHVIVYKEQDEGLTEGGAA